jgi:hypothetical protein
MALEIVTETIIDSEDHPGFEMAALGEIIGTDFDAQGRGRSNQPRICGHCPQTTSNNTRHKTDGQKRRELKARSTIEPLAYCTAPPHSGHRGSTRPVRL